MTDKPAILLTAFEPSGDVLAAKVVRQLRLMGFTQERLSIYALAGPQTAAAGAQVIETTTEQAVMLGSAIKHVRLHHQRVGRLKAWLANNRIRALVPTDSPAANWAICKLVRRRQPQAKIIHLVAPQLWAWAPWRIRKLRRLTDHVLCLLPFEPAWFQARGVNATFVGHPVYDPLPRPDSPSRQSVSEQARDELLPLPTRGHPKLALLPGSRAGEIRHNWPTMRAAAEQLHQSHPDLQAVIALRDPSAADLLRTIDAAGANRAAPLPAWMTLAAGQTDAALAWSDLVLVVSGTATLQVAAHRKPMVVLYNVNWWSWQLAGRWLIQTRTFSLPNLLSQAAGHGRIVPELVPHFGEVDPVIQPLRDLIDQESAHQSQVQALERIAALFAGTHFGPAAAGKLVQVAQLS